MAVLLEGFSLDIITGSKTATGAVRVIVGKHVFAECPECRVVPYFKDTLPAEIPEDFRLHLLQPPAGKTSVTMPEKITGGNIPFPRNESPPLFHKTAATFPSQRNLREAKVYPLSPGNNPGLIKEGSDFV